MRVAVALPLALRPLTYEFSEADLGCAPQLGLPVEVPLRKKLLQGYIVNLNPPTEEKKAFTAKPIQRVIADWPKLSASYLQFLDWAANYYHYPLGEALESALPAKMVLKKPAQFLVGSSSFKASPRPTLVEAQALAVNHIVDALEEKKFHAFLLQGVTGSGKTEVYLRAAEHVLAMGGSVLFLVPEIALTPQLLARVQGRLGAEIALMHSGLGDRVRSEQWHLQHQGKARVALGARSTIFSPLEKLHLIIVDEEHEAAFKQEDRFRYNARDLALLRAKQNNSVVLLGSATPSLESFYKCQTGRLTRLELPERVTGSQLPEVEIVDLKHTDPEKSISPRLHMLIEKTLKEKKQTMLFLNRRGHASFIVCSACGHIPNCPNCSVSLTFYQRQPQLRCHYCNYDVEKYKNCLECNEEKLNMGTVGTEALEEEVKASFPQARVLRMDTESLDNAKKLEEALAKVVREEVDIVVGTQMIAKGHDFPNVHLVAVVHADSTTNFPDFRAAERSFQLFTQMAGRAGRSAWRGKVVLQTYNPKHPSIQHTLHHDYRSFADQELEAREIFHYPPYTRLARILVSDASSEKARQCAEFILRQIQARKLPDIEVLGPAPALLQKLKNKHRWNLLIKSKRASSLNQLLSSDFAHWREQLERSTVLQIDVDPFSLV